MFENCQEELNKLTRAELLQIILTKDVDCVRIDKKLKNHFRKIFSPPCNICNGALNDSEMSKDEFKTSLKPIKEDSEMNDGKKLRDQTGVKNSPNDVYTVSHLDTELKQFYDFCKENNLSDDEIANICKPLFPSVKNFRSKCFIYSVIFVAIVVFLYFLSYFEVFQWHYAALIRIFLLELLPIWNWTDLKGEKCIIKPFVEQPRVNLEDCTFCEATHNIDVMDAKDVDYIYRKYIKMKKPVILENGLEHWMRSPDSLAKFVTKLLDDDIIGNSRPCHFKSNVYYGAGTVRRSLRDLQDYSSYFGQFQNCDFEAVKALRRYVPRPKFLAAPIQPIQYSWLLFSHGYDVLKFKPIVLSDQITIMGQLLGITEIMLQPGDCVNDCRPLRIELAKGEVLIFEGPWHMDYKPDGGDQNLAVILETH